MRIESYDCFVISHALDPRTGPSIAYSSTHAYVVVKVIGARGHEGWGETYRTPGVLAAVDEVLGQMTGQEASLRSLKRDARWMAGGLEGGGFVTSAVSMALEDLRAKELGVSIAEMLGGPTRNRVRKLMSIPSNERS